MIVEFIRDLGDRAFKLFFGATFWSTVLRPGLIYFLLSLVMVLIDALSGENALLRDFIADNGEVKYFAVASLIPFYAIPPMWVGWGVAYRRFNERPIRAGWFAAFPIFTGLIVGPLSMFSLGSVSSIEPMATGELIASMTFGAIVLPPMAFLIAIFFRFAPHRRILS